MYNPAGPSYKSPGKGREDVGHSIVTELIRLCAHVEAGGDSCVIRPPQRLQWAGIDMDDNYNDDGLFTGSLT